MKINNQRQANRLFAAFAGLATGVAWTVAGMILPIAESISNSDLIPYNWKYAVTKILLPMTIGAFAAIVILETRTASIAESRPPISRAARFEWTLYGAVGAVGWWIVPLVLSGVINLLLFISALVGSFLVQGLSTPFYGTLANTPRFLADFVVFANMLNT